MPTGNYTSPPEPCHTVFLQRGPRHAVCSPLSQVWYRDYRANDLLDAYEAEGIDEAPELEDMTLEEREEARRRAEREMNKRDRRENTRGLPGALEGVNQIADSDMLLSVLYRICMLANLSSACTAALSKHLQV